MRSVSWPATCPNLATEQVRHLQALLKTACETRTATLPAIKAQLESAARAAETLAAGVDASAGDDAAAWAAALARQSRDALDDLRSLAPWLELPAVPAGQREIPDFDRIPTLRELAGDAAVRLADIERRLGQEIAREETDWLVEYRVAIAAAAERARARIAACERLAQEATGFATANQEFLYDRTRHLLAIGYNVEERRRDTSFYDLLASEARLATFVAIAQGQLPQESWFALGRLLTTAGGDPVLVSWSGSMFEYLMPLLVMPTYDGTLLDQTCRAAVARQIAYGSQQSLPWGVSESGYNTVDASLNYQYHAFGVPGLGLTRGLAEDLVIAPYATALALMVEPEAACANLQRLAASGMEGRVRILRSHGLHALAGGTRSVQRHRALVHGASPGNEPAVARAPGPRPADAAAIRVGSLVQGSADAAAGADSQGIGFPQARHRACRRQRIHRCSRKVAAGADRSGHADSGGPAAFEWPATT